MVPDVCSVGWSAYIVLNICLVPPAQSSQLISDVVLGAFAQSSQHYDINFTVLYSWYGAIFKVVSIKVCAFDD